MEENSITKCHARTRRQTLCEKPPINGKKRCIMHGGAEGSGAPKGNINARKHGRYSAESLARKKWVTEYFKNYRDSAPQQFEEFTHEKILKEIKSLLTEKSKQEIIIKV
jgi:hypothetical protein